MWISMPELTAILGKDAARTLARHLGGVQTYVPAEPSAAHQLAKIVGVRGMAALCSEFKGEYITVPNEKREPHKTEVDRLLKQGMSKRAVALACGVTERYVYYVAALDPGQEQLTLPL